MKYLAQFAVVVATILALCTPVFACGAHSAEAEATEQTAEAPADTSGDEAAEEATESDEAVPADTSAHADCPSDSECPCQQAREET